MRILQKKNAGDGGGIDLEIYSDWGDLDLGGVENHDWGWLDEDSIDSEGGSDCDLGGGRGGDELEDWGGVDLERWGGEGGGFSKWGRRDEASEDRGWEEGDFRDDLKERENGEDFEWCWDEVGLDLKGGLPECWCDGDLEETGWKDKSGRFNGYLGQCLREGFCWDEGTEYEDFEEVEGDLEEFRVGGGGWDVCGVDLGKCGSDNTGCFEWDRCDDEDSEDCGDFESDLDLEGSRGGGDCWDGCDVDFDSCGSDGFGWFEWGRYGDEDSEEDGWNFWSDLDFGCNLGEGDCWEWCGVDFDSSGRGGSGWPEWGRCGDDDSEEDGWIFWSDLDSECNLDEGDCWDGCGIDFDSCGSDGNGCPEGGRCDDEDLEEGGWECRDFEGGVGDWDFKECRVGEDCWDRCGIDFCGSEVGEYLEWGRRRDEDCEEKDREVGVSESGGGGDRDAWHCGESLPLSLEELLEELEDVHFWPNFVPFPAMFLFCGPCLLDAINVFPVLTKSHFDTFDFFSTGFLFCFTCLLMAINFVPVLSRSHFCFAGFADLPRVVFCAVSKMFENVVIDNTTNTD